MQPNNMPAMPLWGPKGSFGGKDLSAFQGELHQAVIPDSAQDRPLLPVGIDFIPKFELVSVGRHLKTRSSASYHRAVRVNETHTGTSECAIIMCFQKAWNNDVVEARSESFADR